MHFQPAWSLFFFLIIGSRWEGVPRQYPQRIRTHSKLLRPPGVHAVDQGEFLVNFWLDRINKSDKKIVAFLSCCCKYENATPAYIGVYVPCHKCNWNNFVALKLQGILYRFGEAKVPTFKTLIKITTFIAVTNWEFKLYRWRISACARIFESKHSGLHSPKRGFFNTT